MTEYEKIYNKARELLEDARDRGDVDALAVFDFGAEDEICNLFASCYTWQEFCAWLVDHDLDIAQDFRFSDRKEWNEIIKEIDEGEENPAGTYKFDREGWEELTEEQKRDTVADCADCLFITDKGLVISW